mmetsp:Transcript_175375/g.562587  ORF Transcript_175375/g.562587 Transcript_175375/m.562587 type:complete len:207 (-) Transcript_175375:1833-2453(-)
MLDLRRGLATIHSLEDLREGIVGLAELLKNPSLHVRQSPDGQHGRVQMQRQEVLQIDGCAPIRVDRCEYLLAVFRSGPEHPILQGKLRTRSAALGFGFGCQKLLEVLLIDAAGAVPGHSLESLGDSLEPIQQGHAELMHCLGRCHYVAVLVQVLHLCESDVAAAVAVDEMKIGDDLVHAKAILLDLVHEGRVRQAIARHRHIPHHR